MNIIIDILEVPLWKAKQSKRSESIACQQDSKACNAENAIDGNFEMGANIIQNNNNQLWWKAKLLEEVEIEEIHIYLKVLKFLAVFRKFLRRF